ERFGDIGFVDHVADKRGAADRSSDAPGILRTQIEHCHARPRACQTPADRLADPLAAARLQGNTTSQSKWHNRHALLLSLPMILGPRRQLGLTRLEESLIMGFSSP